eukprot:COSAG04_NODE_27302_length_284_cov_1.118919_1_plen_48_part_10
MEELTRQAREWLPAGAEDRWWEPTPADDFPADITIPVMSVDPAVSRRN